MESSERIHRLFFALWPSAELRDQIAAMVEPLIRGVRARPIPPSNFHITLAFLGAVPASQVPNVRGAARAIEASSFQLEFGRVEVWLGAQVLCLTPAPAPQLDTLVSGLRVQLSALAIETDRKDFKPHITIARDWPERSIDRATTSFTWRAQEFVLAESDAGREGSTYQIVDRFRLTSSNQ